MTNVLTELRSIAPVRPVGLARSFRIAELQAARLITLAGVTGPPVPTEAIAGLPRIHVVRTHLEASSAWTWTRGRCVILLNWSDSHLRQRFSLAHQFKHVLDAPTQDVQYPKAFETSASKMAELTADHFAGSLLMPESWLRECLADRVVGAKELSREFDVSEAAIRVRLSTLGLDGVGLRLAG